MRKLTKKRLVEINDDLWSLIVRDRDKHKCKMCGTDKGSGEAHHIIGKDDKGLRWDIENGITLCYYCHRFKIHGGKMSSEKRIEFYKSVSDYDKLKEKSNQVVKFNFDFCADHFALLYLEALKKKIDVSLVPKYVVVTVFGGENE